MIAGSLKDLVTFLQPATGRDAAGQPTVGWTTYESDVWADVRVQGGLDVIRSDKPTSIVRASVRVRMRDDITTAMRVQFGSLTFKINAVLPRASGNDFNDFVCELVQ